MSNDRVETIAATGQGSRWASFPKLGECYLMQVGVRADQHPQALLQDAQGPAFQELHVQDNPSGGAIAFLTGMADGWYWSASVATNEQSLEFDFACRGCSPETLPTVHWQLAPQVTAEAVAGTIQIASPTGASCILSPAASCELTLQANQLTAAPTGSGDPRQWAFRVLPGA